MKSSTKWGLRWTGVFMAVGLLLPVLLYMTLKMILGEVQPEIPITMAGRGSSREYLLFIITALGLIPYILLSGICLLAARRLPPQRLAFVALGGLAAIVIQTLVAHVSSWHVILNQGQSNLGAVVTLLAVPVNATIWMLMAVAFFWFLSKLEYFRS